MFTIWNWVIFVILLIMIIVISLVIGAGSDSIPAGIISLLVGIMILAGAMVLIGWYHTNTASGVRAMKDYQSEIDNGIERTITITAEDGREIFSYEGKVDIESNHEDNYIKFESEDGKRYIIYYGIQDTIQIIEK